MVVGAGVGGLSCAIRLAAAGFRVRVLESAAGSGGKARTVRVGDLDADGGPTVLTMLWVFEELFAAAGASFREHVPMERSTVLARHAWSDGTRLDLHADRAESADAIGTVFGASEARAYLAFCENGRQIFELAESPFLRSQRPTMGTIWKQFGAAGLSALTRIDGHRTMWRSLEQRFAEPRLRQLFGRYATYCGSSPFEAPATLNLVAHVEAEGVYRVRGGMRALVAALERLARSLDVEILHEHKVERIVVERGRANGVIAKESAHEADAVVFNGDVSALGSELLGQPAARAASATAPDQRSLSAVTWNTVARPVGFPLVHHNVFFSDDYAGEFDAILRRRTAPAAPTVYVCAQDRGDTDEASTSERLLVLINAPATGDDSTRWTDSEKDRCSRATETMLAKIGLHLAPQASVQTTPRDFHQLFPATGGALYGPRSTGALSALSRQGSSSKIAGLYLAGGSVHPGPGVPMAALSGRLAAERICEDLASTARSRRAATTGTT